MNIKVVIHKNWLPFPGNLQTDHFPPSWGPACPSANGTEATWGLLRQARAWYKVKSSPPQENLRGSSSTRAAHSGSDRAIIMHLGEN